MIYPTNNYAIVNRSTGKLVKELYGNVEDLFRTYNVHPEHRFAILPFITYLEQYNLAVRKAGGSEPETIDLARFYLTADNRVPVMKHSTPKPPNNGSPVTGSSAGSR